MSELESANAAVARRCDEVRRVFAGQSWIDSDSLSRACASTGEGLRIAQTAGDLHRGDAAVCAHQLAVDLIATLRAELAARPSEAALLLRQLRDEAGLATIGLARAALAAPELLALQPARAAELELGSMLAFAPFRGVSLWSLDAAGRPQCVYAAGEGCSTSASRKLAARLAADDRVEASPRAELFGHVLRSGSALSAIVARCEPRHRERCLAVIGAATPTLEAVLARDALLQRNAAGERALVETGERRLTRLGFDLHDGPLQELLLLAGDLRLFREQLIAVVGADGAGELLRGRLDDLDARLVALEDALRRISSSAHADALASRPLQSAVEDLAKTFAARTGIAPELNVEGDASSLSASQRIALLSVLGEALNNVREHSNARTVRVHVALDGGGLRASVLDDGRGFDVEAALLGAARRGRIGLAGIHERVRLLGGQCTVESQPGGPTTVSLVLPPWEPLAGVQPEEHTATVGG